MKIGTKSLLFGCHQVLWHPLTVLLAYRKLFRRWPNFYGCVAIVVHDWGYWGRKDIDGTDGKLHPWSGAQLTGKIVYWCERFRGTKKFFAQLDASEEACRCLLHSRTIARDNREHPSDICWADKYCIFYEPEWFYLFRTWLSGEDKEFLANAVRSGHIPPNSTRRQWLQWYKNSVLKTPEIHDLLSEHSLVRKLRYLPACGKKNQPHENPIGTVAVCDSVHNLPYI